MTKITIWPYTQKKLNSPALTLMSCAHLHDCSGVSKDISISSPVIKGEQPTNCSQFDLLRSTRQRIDSPIMDVYTSRNGLTSFVCARYMIDVLCYNWPHF